MKIFKFFKKVIKRYNKNKNKKLISAETYNDLVAARQELNEIRTKQRASTKKWKISNLEKVRKLKSSWNKRNPERIRELKRAWAKTPQGKASIAASSKRYYEKTKKEKNVVDEALKYYLKVHPEKAQKKYKTLIKEQKNLRQEEKRLKQEEVRLQDICKETNNVLTNNNLLDS